LNYFSYCSNIIIVAANVWPTTAAKVNPLLARHRISIVAVGGMLAGVCFSKFFIIILE
jgi:hypothetical protein